MYLKKRKEITGVSSYTYMNVENAWWYIRSRIRHHWVWSQQRNEQISTSLILPIKAVFIATILYHSPFFGGILVPPRVPHRCNSQSKSLLRDPYLSRSSHNSRPLNVSVAPVQYLRGLWFYWDPCHDSHSSDVLVVPLLWKYPMAPVGLANNTNLKIAYQVNSIVYYPFLYK